MTSPKNFSLTGFIKLTRVSNLLIIVLAQYFTAYLLAEDAEVLSNIDLFLLSLSSTLIAAAGYMINDYYDVKIDYINKPERVVVGKVIKRRVVMVTHTILNFIGIGIGYLISPWIALINFGSALLLWLYSNQLKRLPFVGNLSVALLTGLSIYIIEVLYNTGSVLIPIYALFAFGFTLIREVIKDMEDMKGDTTFGCRTLPIVFGLRKTKIITSLFGVLFITAISALLYSSFGMALTWLIVGNVVALAVLLIFLSQADTTKHFHQLSTLTKFIMLLGVLSMLLV